MHLIISLHLRFFFHSFFGFPIVLKFIQMHKTSLHAHTFMHMYEKPANSNIRLGSYDITILTHFSLLVASIHFILYSVFTLFRVLFVVWVWVHDCVCSQKKTGILMDEYAIAWNESVQIWIYFVSLKRTQTKCVLFVSRLFYTLFLPHVYFILGVCVCVCMFLVAFIRTITAFFWQQ